MNILIIKLNILNKKSFQNDKNKINLYNLNRIFKY